ncbi:putative cation-transporting ATPase 1, partial [Spiromyces aspiralis]
LVDVKSISSVSLHRRLPTSQHAYIWPFFFVYPAWLYVYTFWYDKYLGSTEPTFISLLVLGTLQLLLYLMGEWNVNVQARFTCQAEPDLYKAELIKVIAAQHHGKSAICPLKFNHDRKDKDGRPEVSFTFQAQLFIYDADRRAFGPIRYPPDSCPTLGEFQAYQGFETDDQLQDALSAFGDNKFTIPIPTFTELFKEHAKAPFFVFQVFCVGLWCLDSYWYYSLFTLVMLVVFESTVVFQRLRTLREFHSLSLKPYGLYVYRKRQWVEIQSDELVPGDIVSITRSLDDNGVPCDVLLLDGTCIVNEAMLSGESTPQLKESIKLRDGRDVLEMEGNDKNNTLFGGTKILQVTPPEADTAASIPIPPDSGCVGYVLRTGFGTSQGKLVRTMVYSTERVSADNMEAYVFISFLLVFAIMASAYVWVEGGRDGKRSRTKLLLDCILIITSVVPPELPMELSMAVNSSLIALSRFAIFCTEPFRIPNAGKVDICCFDKTGTITGENLVVEGIAGVPGAKDAKVLHSLKNVNRDTTLTLATAHALVQLDDGQLVGDPMERAQLEAAGFRLAGNDTVIPADPGDRFLEELPLKHEHIKLEVVRRFAFSSTLKRSSTLSRVSGVGAPGAGYFVAAKGAPETLKCMMRSVPAWYDETYKYFSRRGGRVLALGCKWLDAQSPMSKKQVETLTRESIESDLEFHGFLVFSSPLKPESKKAIQMLNYSSHRCVMITGDNALTAAHVAGEVDMLDQPVLILDAQDASESRKSNAAGEGDSARSDDVAIFAYSIDETTKFEIDLNDPRRMERALQGWDLCITGAAMQALAHTALWRDYLLHHIWVYARVSPTQKEFILTEMKSAGYVTLMCGDGTNDVGALKQAHVGVALLDGKPEDLAKIAERQRIERLKSAYDAQLRLAKRFNQPPPKPPPLLKNYLKEQAEREKEAEKKRKEEAERVAKLSGVKLTSGDKSKRDNRKRQKASEEAEKFEKQLSEARSSIRGAADSNRQAMDDLNSKLTDWLSQMDTVDDEVPTLKFGDASVAAPFTSKLGTIMSICNIVRQGRCTLVATIQMYKILALNCLISAYSLSVLYLDGIKFGDWQATIMGILMSICFFCISKASPLEKLSKERPQPNIINLYIFLTILGQFTVHIFALVYVAFEVRKHETIDEVDIDGDFKPSLLNTAMYLISLSQQIATFAINYQGHPFRESLRENRYLYRGLVGVGAIAAICATETFPELNEQLKLVPMPEKLREHLCLAMLLDFAGAWVIEKVCAWQFATNQPKPITLRKRELKYPDDDKEKDSSEIAIKAPQYSVGKPATAPASA